MSDIKSDTKEFTTIRILKSTQAIILKYRLPEEKNVGQTLARLMWEKENPHGPSIN